jgi:hypothetical protein
MHAERLLWGTVKPLQFAGRGGLDTHVRFGSLADILRCPRHVRFTPVTFILHCRMSGFDPKRTSGLIRTARLAVYHFSLAARSQNARLFSRGVPFRFAQLNGAVFPRW